MQLPCLSPIGWPVPRRPAIAAASRVSFVLCSRMRCRRAFQTGASWAPVVGAAACCGERAGCRDGVCCRRHGAGAVPSSRRLGAAGNDVCARQ
ncbi:hypothetical protein RSPO_m00602 (plasmid) [Ralstonia solanacearum Po82]|uniref:Uncharacterized protein n=1 Tax=Ralstonia solanacearum (strain Po82) TaxID=1031711 RepID=F6G7W2_RALS8|nr:hypothetical protein RSPO_m00602 [Ralstonia solanacearum Po82]